MKNLFHEIGVAVSEITVADALRDMDKDGDSTVTYDEFKKWWIESEKVSLPCVSAVFLAKTLPLPAVLQVGSKRRAPTRTTPD